MLSVPADFWKVTWFVLEKQLLKIRVYLSSKVRQSHGTLPNTQYQFWEMLNPSNSLYQLTKSADLDNVMLQAYIKSADSINWFLRIILLFKNLNNDINLNW